MELSHEQIQDILESHCRRVLDNMNHDDLYNYALRQMKQSFDQNPGVGDIDIPWLISDIITQEDGDSDAASKFLSGCGIDDDIVDELIENQAVNKQKTVLADLGDGIMMGIQVASSET